MNLLDHLSTAYTTLAARLHRATFGPAPYDGSALRARLASFDYVGTATYFVLLAGFLTCFVVPMCGCAEAGESFAPLLVAPLPVLALAAGFGLFRSYRRRVKVDRKREWEASTPSDVFYTYPVGVPSTTLPRPESFDRELARARAEANEDARQRERVPFDEPSSPLTDALAGAARDRQ